MSSLLFENIKIFDGRDIIPSGFVLVSGGVISHVGSQPLVSIPSNTQRVPGADRTLLPGLIDSHVHAHLHPGKGSDEINAPMKLGVTTILDMHNEPDDVNRLKKECRESNELPDLKSSYHGATIDGGWPKPIVLTLDTSEENKAKVSKWPRLTPDTAEAFVIKNKALGADYIKLMQENGCCMAFPNVPPASIELQSALVEASHKHNLLAVAHATNLEETKLVLRAGVDGLAHTFSDQPPTEELITLYKKNNAFLIPTLCTIASIIGEEQDIREHFARHPLVTSRSILDEATTKCMASALGLKPPGVAMENGYESVRVLKEAGIDIVAGTDAVPGLLGTGMGVSLMMELWLYVERCGFSKLDALRSCTGVAARRFGFMDRGLIEKGRRADLLMVEGDPVDGDLEDLMKTMGVWKGGVECPIQTMEGTKRGRL